MTRMDGLDRLVQSIADDADRRALSWIDDAKAYAARLIQDAEAKRDQIAADAEAEAQAETERHLARGQSLLRADRRKADLMRRQNDVRLVMDAALEHLMHRPKEERVTHYIGLIRNQAMPKGELVLSRADDDIRAMLVDKLPEGYTLSEERGAFHGGFLIRQGQIEENMTFDLAIRNHRSELAQAAAALIDERHA